MRVAPRSRDTANTAARVPVSKFVKFIRLMSNCCILPLRYSRDFAEVNFSILHWKTFVSSLVMSLPFILTVIVWLVIIQRDFLPQLIEKSLKVYITFDMVFILVAIVNYMQPPGVIRRDFKIWKVWPSQTSKHNHGGIHLQITQKCKSFHDTIMTTSSFIWFRF